MAVQTYYTPGDKPVRGSFIDEFEKERVLLKAAFQAVNNALAGASSAFDWQESVKNATNVPPGAPVAGDRYLVTAVAAGLWATHEDDIAEWSGSAWLFATPDEGAVTRNETSNKMFIFDGAAWGTWDATVDHGSMVGLGDDDHTQYQLRTEMDVANGYAGLDAGTKVAAAQIQEVIALTDLTDVTTPTGTGEPVLENSPVIVTPTISDLTNANHDHQDAAGGGTMSLVDGHLTDVSAVTGTGSTAVMDTSPTLVTPTIADLTNANHDHQDAAGGGTLDHGAALAGSLADDDHTQYSLLAGRAGGQSMVGGTAASDDLDLNSTSNGTKGDVNVGTAGAGGKVALGNATSTLAVFGAAGTTQQTVADLVDNSGGGVADGTIGVITTGGAAADQAPTADAIAELATKINAINAALKAYGIIA